MSYGKAVFFGERNEFYCPYSKKVGSLCNT